MENSDCLIISSAINGIAGLNDSLECSARQCERDGKTRTFYLTTFRRQGFRRVSRYAATFALQSVLHAQLALRVSMTPGARIHWVYPLWVLDRPSLAVVPTPLRLPGPYCQPA